MKRWKQLIRSARAYDFPCVIPAAMDRLAGVASRAWSSLRARVGLRLAGGRHGRDWVVDGPAVFRSHRRGRIVFGDGCRLVSRRGANRVGGNPPSMFVCIGDGSIRFGDGSGASFVVLSSRAGITIGNRVMLGGNVRIFDHDFHSLDPVDRHDGHRDDAAVAARPVYIGDDVFVGANSIILKGTTIGDRAIIGAGSVVCGRVPADEIWAGNPARCVRRLGEPRAGGPADDAARTGTTGGGI